jgi:hypothetical protein
MVMLPSLLQPQATRNRDTHRRIDQRSISVNRSFVLIPVTDVTWFGRVRILTGCLYALDRTGRFANDGVEMRPHMRNALSQVSTADDQQIYALLTGRLINSLR